MKYKDMVFTKGKDGKFKAKTITVTTKMKVACELCYPKGEELGWVGNLLLIRFRKKFILLCSPFHIDKVYTFPTKPKAEPKISTKKLAKGKKSAWVRWGEEVDAMNKSICSNLGLNGTHSFVKSLIENKVWNGKGCVSEPLHKKIVALIRKWEKNRS